GLRYQQEQIQRIIQGVVMFLEESTTYQYVIQKGQARGEALGQARGEIKNARANVLRLGAKRFGPATQAILGKIEAIDDLTILETLLDRVIEAKNWDEIIDQV
ncbi:MAG: hypothetical protein ACRC8S_07695, partial [Fimbriiglobus sp.]